MKKLVTLITTASYIMISGCSTVRSTNTVDVSVSEPLTETKAMKTDIELLEAAIKRAKTKL